MKTKLINYIAVIIGVVFFNIFLGLLITFTSSVFFDNVLSRGKIIWDNFWEEFIVVVLFAPFVETFLFQSLTFKFLQYVTQNYVIDKKSKDVIFIVYASILFAYFHQYNWLYFFNILLVGISLNASYIYFNNRSLFPYLSVVLIHLLYNCFAFVLNHYIL